MAPLLPRFSCGAGTGFVAGFIGAAPDFTGAAVGFSDFLLFSSVLAGVGLAALGLPGFAATTLEAFGGVLRRNDFVGMQPPDTRGGI
jgi:hypothetical protein